MSEVYQQLTACWPVIVVKDSQTAKGIAEPYEIDDGLLYWWSFFFDFDIERLSDCQFDGVQQPNGNSICNVKPSVNQTQPQSNFSPTNSLTFIAYKKMISSH